MKFGVVVFPGSNCDHDALWAIEHNLGQESFPVWHRSEDLNGADAIILPGGFSYGDYLRAGAIAHLSPVMGAVKKFAASGGLVIGICNGFQVLTESGLLPGALIYNSRLKFSCKTVYLRAETLDSPFTSACSADQPLAVPIAHGEGSYFADPETLAELESQNRVAFRYVTPQGEATPEANPNGSVANIARTMDTTGTLPLPAMKQ